MNAIGTTKLPQIDPQELRNVLGCFTTGVAVVTTVGEGAAPVGMTINSFSSVSLDPPLILWSINLKTPSYSAFSTHPGFAINILGSDCKDLSLQFAQPSENKFDGIDWYGGQHDVPILDSALATLECETEDRITYGDHEIFIGRVIKIDKRDGAPLVFHRGNFVSLGPEIK